MKYGERFKLYRVRQKLSQKEAAELMDIKPYQLANYETNRSEPSIEVLKAMSVVYKVSIDNLVNNVRLSGRTLAQQKAFEEERAEFAKKLEDILEGCWH